MLKIKKRCQQHPVGYPITNQLRIHPITNRAQYCLTSVMERELVQCDMAVGECHGTLLGSYMNGQVSLYLRVDHVLLSLPFCV